MKAISHGWFPLMLLLALLPSAVWGTHNRAGEITYEQIGDLTIRATITTYTKASSTQADRDSLEIFWGDGTSEIIGRVNGGGNGVLLPNDMKLNLYIAEHTYPGRATYTISMMDPNRIAGIENVNFPNSVIVPFYIETTFTFLNPQFQGYNNSVILLQPPIDNGCTDQPFIHNPNAYDPDGDSLAYELIMPLQAQDSTVPKYEFPDMVMPGPDNQISLDERTGDFVWDAPQLAGDYNIAILIKEYRNGVLINQTIRDMQINIRECDNRPPMVLADEEICVIAGETVELPVEVIDPDPSPPELVTLTALGGPFELDISPAELLVSDGYQLSPLQGTFRWQTRCEHISEQYYSVIFKGEDNEFDSIGLVDLKTVRIKVNGPAPDSLDASSDTETIDLRWAEPYACEETVNDYFQGFTIWRKNSSTPVIEDSCGVDLRAFGYSPVAFNVQDLSQGEYVYSDDEVEKGITYCYRVTAEFALISPGGYPYNRVQSLPSREVCIQLKRDIPLITNVSVEVTDETDGRIRLAWENPLAADLDTLENPGPYRLQIFRADSINGSGFVPVPTGSFNSTSFSGLRDDTTFTDREINTVAHGYNYRIGFYTEGKSEVFDYSAEASSVFLQIRSSDQKNTLVWDYIVPWTNLSTNVYRFDPASMSFDLIGTTQGSLYEDEGLTNGESYCYVVRTTGTYGISGVKDPLLNYSEEACGIPIDTVAPCSPLLDLTNICTDPDEILPVEQLVNFLNWEYPPPDCDNDNDMPVSWQIFFAADSSQGFDHLVEIEDPFTFEYAHEIGEDLGGCYFIVAIDSSGNTSKPGNIICSDNCPLYELPNVFTPNEDGANDLFQPFPYRFVDRVDFKVYNRWGTLVFQTEDPDLNWDGTNENGKELAEGTYYYSCEVFNRTQSPATPAKQLLTGYIELIR